MKLCYQVATPDVAIADSVTAYQGPLDASFSAIAALGYDGVELMTLDPGKLDWKEIRTTAEKYGLCIVLVCTGEVYGQLRISFTDPDEKIRRQAIDRVKEIIEFAGYLGANVNIGRVRGQYYPDIDRDVTWNWAVEAFREICDCAASHNVSIALETIAVVNSNFINTMAEAEQMIHAVDRRNFFLMMDVFHINLEEKDLIQAIDLYSKYNIHVHLSDNNRRYPGNCGLDFEKILAAFLRNGYHGAFCTEILQMPSMEAAAARSIEHIAPIAERVYGRPAK